MVKWESSIIDLQIWNKVYINFPSIINTIIILWQAKIKKVGDHRTVPGTVLNMSESWSV